MKKVRKNKTQVIKTTLMDRVNQEIKTFVETDIVRLHDRKYEVNVFGGVR